MAASYFFYGYADWKMLPLLIIATLVFFYLGIGIKRSKSEKTASWLTVLGVVLGVGLLLYFKYLDFFILSFAHLFESMGFQTNWHTFNIIMPLGVSFFTFKLISYVIEIHREEIDPTNNVVDFATYIAFFPCILSGPIDRPGFISQLQQKREFDYNQAVDGLRQILWGLFMKLVVADNCAKYVDQVFSSYMSQSGSTLLWAAILCSFQMYADFSGYSDMAIGVGKLLGLRITRNFKFPFFALNMAEFWRRWHISLTTWLTDYVFTPLNFRFRHWRKTGMILAIVINMVLVGLWHGANWTYVLFGLYHGLLFVPLILSGAFLKKNQLRTNSIGLPVLKDFLRMLLTFALVTFGVIIFRAASIGQAWEYVRGIGDRSLFSIPWLKDRHFYIPLVLSILAFLIVEWIQKDKEHALDLRGIKSPVLKNLIYVVLIVALFWFGGHAETFIYFQF
ncbi:MAG: MBOAT family protein [Bacteroidales bacterium]|nr:MBOAT family protein [Bacteroidales bacterium]